MSHRTTPPIWLRASQAAALAGVSRQTLWRWIVSGVIPDSSLLRHGKHTRVSRLWLEGKA